MSAINTILIDDESNALKALRYELNILNGRLDIIAQFTDVEEAANFLKTNPNIDLVFLDIEMPAGNGLDFMKRFNDPDFFIIFTTAYSQYAVNAFKLNAIDYLLKPIDPEELERAVAKVEKALQKEAMETKLLAAVDKLNEMDGKNKRVKINFDGKIIFFEPSEIVYCEGDGNYCNVHLQSGEKMLLSIKLKNLEEILPPLYFYRIHNSFIINLSKIKSFNRNDGTVELVNKTVIPVSRHKRIEILSKL